MTDLTEGEFEELVADAVASLPHEILQHMNNVAVTVADWPSPDELRRSRLGRGSLLFGLYEGVPLTKRGGHYNLVAPDRIIIFRGPLQNVFRTPDALQQQIRRTVVHEIAHHFGLSEARIRELGY
jgi:predicted Zn-dependent protease with MMP-like domain